MTINEKIVELLDWSGMSQRELSRITGIPQTTISTYVTGKSTVSIENAYKIAKGLNVSPWTILNCEPLPATWLEMTREEQDLIADIRSLNNDQRELIVESVKVMVRQNRRK